MLLPEKVEREGGLRGGIGILAGVAAGGFFASFLNTDMQEFGLKYSRNCGQKCGW